MKKKLSFLLIFSAMLLTGSCAQLTSVVNPITNLATPFPEEIILYPEVNSYGRSKVGVFRFDEPAYIMGTGVDAADSLYDCLLKKKVFASITNEITEKSLSLSEKLAIARSKGYDLLVTGAVQHYFEGGEFLSSSVHERIMVIHLPTNRILWSARAEGTAAHMPAIDYKVFQTRGHAAPPASTLFQENAVKFCNMLLKKQTQAIENPIDVYFRSQKEALADLEKRANLLTTDNKLLEQQLLKECQKAKQLTEAVDTLSVQASQLEQQLKEEVERGEITLKRYKNKTIINIDNSICFDSGSNVLKWKARQALNKIAGTLNNFPDHGIQVQGHTDNDPIHGRGRFAGNWELSSARSLSVLRYLLKQSNVNPYKFSAAGFGEYHPIRPNDTKENKRLNRRVDIVILPGGGDINQKSALKKDDKSKTRL